jgi:hypothetical protein
VRYSEVIWPARACAMPNLERIAKLPYPGLQPADLSPPLQPNGQPETQPFFGLSRLSVWWLRLGIGSR